MVARVYKMENAKRVGAGDADRLTCFPKSMACMTAFDFSKAIFFVLAISCTMRRGAQRDHWWILSGAGKQRAGSGAGKQRAGSASGDGEAGEGTGRRGGGVGAHRVAHLRKVFRCVSAVRGNLLRVGHHLRGADRERVGSGEVVPQAAGEVGR